MYIVVYVDRNTYRAIMKSMLPEYRMMATTRTDQLEVGDIINSAVPHIVYRAQR